MDRAEQVSSQDLWRQVLSAGQSTSYDPVAFRAVAATCRTLAAAAKSCENAIWGLLRPRKWIRTDPEVLGKTDEVWCDPRDGAFWMGLSRAAQFETVRAHTFKVVRKIDVELEAALSRGDVLRFIRKLCVESTTDPAGDAFAERLNEGVLRQVMLHYFLETFTLEGPQQVEVHRILHQGLDTVKYEDTLIDELCEVWRTTDYQTRMQHSRCLCWHCVIDRLESDELESEAVSYTHLTLPTKRIVEISVGAASFDKKKEM
eukprot:TRINITY_DN11093_c0_g1_i1.p1 TRINITY_DN11093_c0_g1~~TRINITY_DN11093_c0_g1_i1.p1  ORF type:complete len:259 (-),score=9.52 TRINITY_DN11093_c0_g1_i1:66-842(-)